jgi:hypothetical protein
MNASLFPYVERMLFRVCGRVLRDVAQLFWFALAWALPQLLSGQTNIEPRLIGQWPGYARGDAMSVQVVGNIAYVAQETGGLGIYDISNPGRVLRLGGYDTSGFAHGIQVVGTVAYVADSGAGLQILDVSNPAQVTRLGGYDTSGSARGIQVVGTVAYVADEGAGLQILDVSDPAQVTRLGGYDTSWDAYVVQVVGTVAYGDCQIFS